MKIVFSNVRQKLPHFDLELDLELDTNRIAFVGPSGAGKTTAVELISGLRKPDEGSIAINERVFADAATRTHVPIAERGIGYAPQDDAIFPHLSVSRNLRFAPPRNGGNKFDEAEVMEQLRLRPLLHGQKVSRLSGGERRRIALARALLSAPELILLDEPFTGLDDESRGRAIELLDSFQASTGIPWILVSHARDDIAALADAVVEFENGKTWVR